MLRLGQYIMILNSDKASDARDDVKPVIVTCLGLLSFDKSRKQFVLGQFHVEGFVNQYLMTSSSADGKTFVFTTESIENIPAGWRARETYRILSADEFVEEFELAAPGKDFELYSESRHQRKK